MLLFVAAVSFSLLFSFLCSLAEATLLSVGNGRVEQLARSGSRAGTLLRRWKQHPDQPIAAILVLNTIANSGGAAIATDQFGQNFPGVSTAWFASAFVVAVLTLTEIVPKTIGVVHANRLAVPMTLIVGVMVVLLAPILRLTQYLSRAITKKPATLTTSLEEIRLLATAGHSQGAFGAITAGLIQNATRLRDTKARDVMVPRHRVAILSGAASTEANLKLIQRSGHSRFPFAPNGELDTVSGVILTKELLFALRERSEPDWEDLQVPMLIVPESATLNHVLRHFQREKRHMAIVVDEYGTAIGIITLEDVLEEIVGEIEDELDTEETHLLERADGSLLCRGSAEVRKVLARLGIEEVETSSQTLSGFLAEQTGDVPAAGTHIDFGGYRFLVTKANNRRVERVRVQPLGQDPPPAS